MAGVVHVGELLVDALVLGVGLDHNGLAARPFFDGGPGRTRSIIRSPWTGWMRGAGGAGRESRNGKETVKGPAAMERRGSRPEAAACLVFASRRRHPGGD